MNGIVCNTGPLIALGILDKLDLLKTLFDEIWVPDAVANEIQEGGLKVAGLESFRKATWIRRASPKAQDALLTALLDTGEAAVILLARERGLQTVLIDERKARKVARDVYGIQPIGTARVLVEAKKHGLLNNVSFSLETLRREGYWIHDDIVHTALREVGESS